SSRFAGARLAGLGRVVARSGPVSLISCRPSSRRYADGWEVVGVGVNILDQVRPDDRAVRVGLERDTPSVLGEDHAVRGIGLTLCARCLGPLSGPLLRSAGPAGTPFATDRWAGCR